MLSRCYTASLGDADPLPVEVEVDLAGGLPGFHLVGLPDHASREGRERVRAAIRNQGFTFPVARAAVNLAPAAVPKQGSGLDLPIAACLLASSDQLDPAQLEGWALWGELALDGRLRPQAGALGVARSLAARAEVRRLLVPTGCGAQAAVRDDLQVFEASDLRAAVEVLRAPGRAEAVPLACLHEAPAPDWSLVRAAPWALDALQVAAGGGHGLSLVGPPGCGKTFWAQRLVELLPPLSRPQAFEVADLHSRAGQLAPEAPVTTSPPLRAPGPTTSREGLVGGGRPLRAGEATLAHRGVLFLDEAAEFSRPALDSLRGPLVDRRVRVARAGTTVELPADFLLVLAWNPCPCGFHGVSGSTCLCSPGARTRYQARLSGPLLDRVDVHLRLPRIPPQLSEAPPDPGALRRRVLEARARQHQRWGDARLNRDVSLPELSQSLGPLAREAPSLPPRGLRRLLSVARTLADLAGEAEVQRPHLARAQGLTQVRPQAEAWAA